MMNSFQQQSVPAAMNNSPANSALRALDLEDYRVLVVAGDDRIDFLQGQLTQDVASLAVPGSALAGWATAKGRLLAVGQLVATPDALLWPLPADIVDDVQRRLGMFRLRARADIRLAGHAVAGLCGLDPAGTARAGHVELGDEPGAATISDGLVAARLIGDPTRALAFGPPDTIGAWLADTGFARADQNEWRLLDIRAGLPAVVAATAEAFIPQMLNLDLLGGISFTKGCYVGQEIVARTQNLGRIKRRMYRFRCAGSTRLEPGAVIYGPEAATGKVVMAARTDGDQELTAVVAIDESTQTWFADQARTIGLEPEVLPYDPSERHRTPSGVSGR